MKTFATILVAAAALTAVVAVPEDLSTYTFQQYCEEFGKDYTPGSYEYDTAEATFKAGLADIMAHNAAGHTWTKGVNRFTDMPASAMAAMYGRSKGASLLGAKSGSASALPAEIASVPLSDLPAEVDWRKNGVATAVKNQGSCGSCWAFAATEVLESHVAINTGYLFDLGVEQIVQCAPNPKECGGTGGCSGATAQIGWDYVKAAGGVTSEYQYPYASGTGVTGRCNVTSHMHPVASLDGYVNLPANNYTALMQAVALVGPVAVSVDASAWSAYNGGVYSGCDITKNVDIDHAVVLMGYGTDSETGLDYFLIRNSWSPTWGDHGYIKLQRFGEGANHCGIDSTPQDGDACKGETAPVKVCGQCGVLSDSAYPLGAKTL